MSCDISEGKQRLPLPTLLHRLGLGKHAKKSARCPFHDDKNNSFSIWKNGTGSWFWKCHSGCGGGDEITFLEKHHGTSNKEATKRFLTMAGGNGTTSPPLKAASEAAATLDWQACVEAFTKEHVEQLAQWRGYSIEFCALLKETGLVGLYDGCIAFPVHDHMGNVIAVHYRLKDGSWRYFPQGVKVRPLVIGELVPGDMVHIFESQWDAFAFMDNSGERGGIVVTRGAGNGALLTNVIAENAKVYLWTQNDAAAEKWQRDICADVKVTMRHARIPAAHKDLNDWTRAGGTAEDLMTAMMDAEIIVESEKPLIEFKTPLQLKNFVPPPGMVLVGDCHIARGSVFVIGGAPGVGKSRSSVALAEAGATCRGWFGLKVHRRFKTMIIQTENGLFRLSREFSELNCDALENYVRVCPPRPFGLCLGRDDFRAQLAAEIRKFKPDLIILDPWNAAARDEKAREYLDTFQLIRSILPIGDDAPAIGIVAHTRKPRADERAIGRALLNLLAGSYVLGSVPRTVFVMQAASDDTEDNRIIWTCCKNNDGELGARSAWGRRNGLFAPVPEFEWDNFDNQHKDDRVTISADDLAEVFGNGEKEMTRADAAKALQALTGAGRTACYDALKSDGRFTKHLHLIKGLLSWKG